MTKIGYVIAALGAIAFAAPSIASAETVVIKHGDHHRSHAMDRMHDHGGHHHAHVVIHDHRG